MEKVAIVCASDKGSKGEREDLSTPVIERLCTQAGYEVTEKHMVPDDKETISSLLKALCDSGKIALVLTSGGTGLSPRDVTPESTLAIAERLVPGISEAMRAESMKITPRAMLSRGVSVQRNRTLVINLPGSPKAVEESLSFILPALKHGIDIAQGNDHDCARG
jgi:molybdopterin adenylyltransferase